MSPWRSSDNGAQGRTWNAWLQQISIQAVRWPAEALVLAHGQCLSCCIGTDSALHVEAHGDYDTLDELLPLLGQLHQTTLGARSGRLEVFVGCDLAPCMVLSREGTLELRAVDWETLATTAMMPWPEEAATFALRFSGTHADVTRVSCFVPRALIDALQAVARTLKREVARCEPLPALAVALAQAQASTGSVPPARAVNIVLGGLQQYVELDEQFVPSSIRALAPAGADEPARALNLHPGAARLRLDFDRLLGAACRSQADRHADAALARGAAP